MTSVINDWLVKVRFDTSDVNKGAAKIEKMMSRIDRVSSKATNKQTVRLNKQNEALTKQNRLESQRLSLRKKISQAESLGIKDLKRERGALGGTNPVKIRSQVLELDKRITLERKKQKEIESKRRAEEIASKGRIKGQAAVKQFTPFQLPFDRQLKFANTIDSVVRRAGVGLGETSAEFQKISVSANRLKDTIGKISSRTDLEKLNNEIRILRERTTQATSAIRQQNAAMTKQKFIAKGVTDSLRNMARSYVSIFAAIEGGRGTFRIGRDFEDIGNTMLLASGSSEKAAKDFQFITQLSERMGLSLRDTTRAFSKFSVAGSSAGLASSEINKVFEDLTLSIRATGLTQDRANLSFLAFQQMLSGPVIQAQEMNQIIEQMPQFTGIAKKALAEMGMEVENYREAVATGTVDSKEFVTTVARLMSEQAKQTGAYDKSLRSMTAAQGRFNTSLELTVNQLFEGGGREGIVSIFDGLAKIVKSLGPFFKAAGASLRAFGQLFGTQLKIYSGVVNIFTSLVGVVNSLISLIPGLGRSMGDAKGEASGLLKIFNSVLEVAKKIQAIFQLAVGTIERLARGDSLTSLVDELLKVKGSGAQISGPGFLARQIPVLGNLLTTGSAIASKAASVGNGGSKVNSDNTLNATINVPSGDPVIIRETMDMWWQDTMKKGS